MNITQDVVTDLLPVYFSGEASSDTKSLVEEYFRGNPDFERMARSAGTPLETLRTAPPVGRLRKGEARPGERPLRTRSAQVDVRPMPVPHAQPAVLLFHTWPSRFSDDWRLPLGGGVLLEHGGALLVPLFRAPAPAHGLPGGCDLS